MGVIIAFDGSLYVVCGQDGTSALDSTECFSPKTNTRAMRVTASMNYAWTIRLFNEIVFTTEINNFSFYVLILKHYLRALELLECNILCIINTQLHF